MTEGLLIVANPPKSASTWLYEALWSDPRVRVTLSKEVRHFSDESARSDAWYLRQFRDGQPGTRRIDVCHDYFASRIAPTAAARFDGDVRVSMLLRDPLERLLSDLNHRYRQGRLPARIRGINELPHQAISDSCYGENVARWVKALGVSNVFVWPLEEAVTAPSEFMQRFYRMCDIGMPAASSYGESQKRSNEAAAVRSPHMTRVLRSGGAALQNMGLHRVVHRVKRSPAVARLVYSAGSPQRVVVDEDVQRHVQGLVRAEVAALEDVLGRPFGFWWPSLGRPAE